MGTMASQITSLTIVYSTVYSGSDQRKHQSSASLAFVRWIHRGPVNSPHKWPVTRKMFPFDDVIMYLGLHFHIINNEENDYNQIASVGSFLSIFFPNSKHLDRVLVLVSCRCIQIDEHEMILSVTGVGASFTVRVCTRCLRRNHWVIDNRFWLFVKGIYESGPLEGNLALCEGNLLIMSHFVRASLIEP